MIALDPNPTGYGRTDFYRKDGRLVLHLHADGRMRFFHKDLADGILVSRDVPEEKRASPEPARKNQPVEVKLRLGHYASGDAALGFVLDRTGPKPKLRFDGTEEVLVLASRPGAYGRTEIVRPDGRLVVFLYPDGRVLAFHRLLPDGVPVHRDADADPLP